MTVQSNCGTTPRQHGGVPIWLDAVSLHAHQVNGNLFFHSVGKGMKRPQQVANAKFSFCRFLSLSLSLALDSLRPATEETAQENA